MHKMSKSLLGLSIFLISFSAFSDSTMRVINKSNVQIQAIWQAGGCLDVVKDWENDDQFTVCADMVILPGSDGMVEFDWYFSDRSVKVFSKAHGRIAYCNSMDNSTLTIYGPSQYGFDVDSDCP